jgi:menaquinone-dependent protoporphyrinogen oxidase
MPSVLVAYATNAGSTEKVAQVIGEHIAKSGASVDVRTLASVTQVESYDAIVVGAPMIMGWHGAAAQFLKRYQRDLSQKRVALFVTALNLTQTNEKSVGAIPIYVDPALAKPPKNPKRLSLKERYVAPSNYLRSVLQAAPSVKPVSVGFFGGKLELYRLPLLHMLFVLLVIQAQPGDFRNWPAIQEWAACRRTDLLNG